MKFEKVVEKTSMGTITQYVFPVAYYSGLHKMNSRKTKSYIYDDYTQEDTAMAELEKMQQELGGDVRYRDVDSQLAKKLPLHNGWPIVEAIILVIYKETNPAPERL